jgi:DNA (cytosine-5)-methyltransferase 1
MVASHNPACTLTAREYKGALPEADLSTVVAFAQNQRDEVRTMDVAGSVAGQPGIKQQTYLAQAFQRRIARNGRGQPEEICPALQGADAGATSDMRPCIAFQSAQSGVREVDSHATLDANNGSRRQNGIVGAFGVRRLTPRECERLQGFPDDYTLVPYNGKPSADGPRYRALGNSMAVPVVRWIGERIQLIDCHEC